MPEAADTLAVSFELSERDLEYFRGRLARAREKHADAGEAAVIGAAKGLVPSLATATMPGFVRARIDVLLGLIAMLEDAAWKLEGEHRARIVSALTYFIEPDDLIPDRVPGVGYLDDAIMIELVAQDLAPEIDAYRDFLAFRAAHEDADAKRIDQQRETLQRRARWRRSRTRPGRGVLGITLI